MGRKFKLSTGEVADIEDGELDEFMNDMKASGRTVRLVKDDSPVKDVVIDVAKPIAAVAEKPVVTTTVVETKDPEPERQRAITDFMRSEGKSGSDVVAAHPELARGMFKLDKPAPPPTLSQETDLKAADTAPSNPENERQGWLRGLLGGGGAKPTEDDTWLKERAARLESDGAMQGGRDYVADLNDPMKFSRLLVGAGLNFGGQALAGPGAGIGKQALGAAISSGGSSLARGEDAADIAKDTGWGAAIGAALPTAFKAVGKPLKWVGDAFSKGADSARLEAALGNGADDILARESQRRGISADDAKKRVLDLVETYVPANKLAPHSPGEYAAGLSGGRDSVNNLIEDEIRAAQSSNVPGKLPQDLRGDVAQSLMTEAGNQATSGTNAGRGLGRAMASEADAVYSGPQFQDPWAVRDQKIKFDKAAFRESPLVPETPQHQAAKFGADQYRNALNNYVEKGNPAGFPTFRAASDDYGLMKEMADAASNNDVRSQSGGGWIPNAIRGIAGAAAGNAVGGPMVGAAGAVAGAGRGMSSPYVADLGANLGKGAAAGFRGLAAPFNAAGEYSGIPASLIAQAAGRANGGQPPPSESTPGQSDAYSQSSASENSRGQNMPANAARVMTEQPQLFAPYKDSLDKAHDAGPDAFEAELERLALTDKNFQRNVWPLLTGAAGR